MKTFLSYVPDEKINKIQNLPNPKKYISSLQQSKQNETNYTDEREEIGCVPPANKIQIKKEKFEKNNKIVSYTRK